MRRQSVLGRELLEALEVWQSCIHRWQGLDGDGDDETLAPSTHRLAGCHSGRSVPLRHSQSCRILRFSVSRLAEPPQIDNSAWGTRRIVQYSALAEPNRIVTVHPTVGRVGRQHDAASLGIANEQPVEDGVVGRGLVPTL